MLTDRSTGMATQSRTALRGMPQLRLTAVADASQLPFPDAAFDAVIANHMLYYVPDIPATLRELRRVVRPGGQIFTATNGSGHLRELRAVVAAFDPMLPFVAQSGERYALENAPALLESVFDGVEVRRYVDALQVTDVQALVDYVLSAAAVQALPTARQTALATFVREQCTTASGTFQIAKDAGLICGRRR